MSCTMIHWTEDNRSTEGQIHQDGSPAAAGNLLSLSLAPTDLAALYSELTETWSHCRTIQGVMAS